jgi:hypothetical protein
MKMGGIEALERICSYQMATVNFAKNREELRQLYAKRQFVAGLEKQYKQEKKELERLKADEARRKEAEMSETEKLKARADKLEAELTQERSERLRLKIASKHALPDTLASRLKGETEEELEADAQELEKLLPTKTEEKKQPQLKATDIANGQNGKTDAQRRAEIYNRGASPFDTANAKANGGGVFFTEK